MHPLPRHRGSYFVALDHPPVARLLDVEQVHAASIRVGDGEYERVEFQNISLVPGEDQGFKIVPQKKE